MARIVVPGLPHHVTQRGIRRQTTFFNANDYRAYLKLLNGYRHKYGLRIWAYCLMPNHVHLVAVPNDVDSLANTFKLTHQRYARATNARQQWQGHLWQARFYSTVLSEPHLIAAVRYVELNPVRAGLCNRALEWPWSSVHSHLHGKPDPAVDPGPVEEIIPDWRSYLSDPGDYPSDDELRQLTGSGRPAGNSAFIAKLEALTGRRIRPRKPGRKPRRRTTKSGGEIG